MKFVGTDFKPNEGSHKFKSIFNCTCPITVTIHDEGKTRDNTSDHVITIDSFELTVYADDKNMKNETKLSSSAKLTGITVDTTASSTYTKNTILNFGSYLNYMYYIK